ncbi:TRAP transporter small permease [Aminithiophilus ramosus]|uniref:TRAP transporter small permease n=1 Tax=Aminithiophilus ramosus TaxID=3029084 RepID=A0A9Q7ARB4_9BACT|nr:TRAP transporter small permease [Aminithiophilus ramosus]QTX33332.1 TRAP transporter small permease [Aminithiophilus ramosus]
MTAFPLRRLARGVETLSAVVASSLLLINVGDVLFAVVLRYLFGSSVAWTEEVARYSLIWLVMAGAAGAQSRGDHMVLDLLGPRLPRRARRTVRGLVLAVQVTVLILLVVLGAKNVAGTWTMKTMALGIPKAVVLSALPVGMALLLVQLLLGRVTEDGR